VIVVASGLLGAVFVLSAILKFAASQQWRVQSADLGVPAFVAGGLPFVELGVGAMLVAQIARRPVAVVAAALLVAFTTLLVVRLLQGRHPPCACFGALSTNPIGWGDVVRNAGFILLAAVVALS
jgi:uncharacterized membrane protein YphA (DoxX/SURF4 family)